MIDIIERNSNRLNNLTDDILNLSEIENNEKNNKLERKIIDLKELVENVEEIICSSEKVKKINIIKNFQNAPLPFNGYPNELEKIFTNLLQNSLKFAPKNGEIEINITQHLSLIHI